MNLYKWNDNLYIQNNEEVNVEAVEGDIVEEVGGYVVLIQRQNDFNNIVFAAVAPEWPLCRVFQKIKEICIDNNIQFVRVEGNLHRYKYLGKMVGLEQLQDRTITSRNVYYLKVF